MSDADNYPVNYHLSGTYTIYFFRTHSTSLRFPKRSNSNKIFSNVSYD